MSGCDGYDLFDADSNVRAPAFGVVIDLELALSGYVVTRLGSEHEIQSQKWRKRHAASAYELFGCVVESVNETRGHDDGAGRKKLLACVLQ